MKRFRLLTAAEQKIQAARCGCRGSDDYCGCQNVPDRETRRLWVGEEIAAILVKARNNLRHSEEGAR